jgi:hypothetical protein
MFRILTVLGFVSLCASMAPASQFYLRYDADETFPEQEGWTRYTYGPGHLIERGVTDGIFWLDTRASHLISDTYRVTDPAIEPGTEELLRVTWRMRTVETDTSYYFSDVLLSVANDWGFAKFYLAPGFVSAQGADVGMPEHIYPVEVGLMHTYRFVTTDMVSYQLYVDDQFAFEEVFTWNYPVSGPYVAFGDGDQGNTSLSEWDYVAVAVIPEPATVWVFVIFSTVRFRRGR